MKTKRILAMAICAVLWLSSTVVLAGETAAPTNLLASFDPSFESGEWAEGVLVKSNTAFATDDAHTGTYSADLSASKPYVQWTVGGLKPATNYTFSFWMINSKANILEMALDKNLFTVDGLTFAKVLEENPEKYDWYTSTLACIGTYTFGAARTGDDIAWRQVSVNFTTPHEDCNGVILRLQSTGTDPNLLIDDVSLVETGNLPNRILNGDLEALDTAGSILTPVGLTTQSTTNTKFANVGDENGDLFLENDGSNHYVHFTTNTAIESRALVSKNALIMQGSSLGKRYKVSFKFKNPDGIAPAVRIRDKNSLYIDAISRFPVGTANTWETYNLYIDATDFINDGLSIAKEVWFGYFDDQIIEAYLDDLYTYYDENSIDFYESLTFYENGGNRFFSGLKKTAAEGDTPATYYFENALTSEKAVEAKSLAQLSADGDGYKSVTTRAHYLPVEGEGGSFAEQSITLISAVYKYEGGVKTLESVGIETGTSTNGQVIDVVDTVIVPENTATATYKVEATVWDSVNSLKPLMEKAVLN